MLASSQGGINIEEVAKESPESIMAEPVNVNTGLTPGQTTKVAKFMGFEGDQQTQVMTVCQCKVCSHSWLWVSSGYDFIENKPFYGVWLSRKQNVRLFAIQRF